MPVTITGSSEASQRLGEQAARIAAPREFLDAEAAALQAILRAAMASGDSPSGGRWPARVTASRDVRTGRARPRQPARGAVGVRTGRLLAGQTVDAMPQGLRAHNDVPYAVFINAGTRKMRARRIMPTRGGGGPVGEWLAGFGDRLARFITTGRA